MFLIVTLFLSGVSMPYDLCSLVCSFFNIIVHVALYSVVVSPISAEAHLAIDKNAGSDPNTPQVSLRRCLLVVPVLRTTAEC